MFQHTAARRRLLVINVGSFGKYIVSTHSRPKAAAGLISLKEKFNAVSTHSRPKAAAPYLKK